MGAKPKATTRRRKRIRVTQLPAGVFKKYAPKLGAEYLAEFPPPNISSTGFCVIEVNRKKIVLMHILYKLKFCTLCSISNT